MSKKGKISYEEVLDLLKNNTYEAPNKWEQIEDGLDLIEGLSSLSTYSAPVGLWDNIEQALESEDQPSQQIQWVKWISSFAAILLLIITVCLLNKSAEEIETEFHYKTEIQMASLEVEEVEMDEDIEEVMMYIEDNSFLYSEERIKDFRDQLKDIYAAMGELIEMQKNYGRDNQSNRMIAGLERDKAKLMKSIIADI